MLFKYIKNEIIKSKIKNTINTINYFQKASKINKTIVNELKKLGYNFKYKGTHYIYNTVVYIYTSNNFDLLDNLENLYCTYPPVEIINI